MVSQVRVAGVGMTPFGKSPERTAREMFGDAADEAFEDAGVDPDDVEEVFYGNFMGEFAEQQGHQGPLAASAAGVRAPATRIESACASSGVAVRMGVEKIRSGAADVVLVGGAERMTNLSTADGTAALAAAADALYEINAGVTFPGAYSLMANRYFEECGGDREDLAHVAVKNHDHAVDNELAQFQMEITVEKVLDAVQVCSPFGLFDCSPMSDGGSAAVLVGEEFAEENSSLTSTAVLPPSLIGEQSNRPNGEQTCTASSTFSTVIDIWNCASSLSTACSWFLTATWARSSRSPPCFSKYRFAISEYAPGKVTPALIS